MSAQAARLLVESGDGDGALLYLALLESGGDGDRAAARLRWPDGRLRPAWDRLAALGLARSPGESPVSPPKQDDRLPKYTREDLTAAQERERDTDNGRDIEYHADVHEAVSEEKSEGAHADESAETVAGDTAVCENLKDYIRQNDDYAY